MVIATHSALPEASSEVKERVLEEMVKMAVDEDVSASRVVDKKEVVVKEAALETISKDKALELPMSSNGASKVALAVNKESYSYAFAQIKPMTKSVAEIWSHYKPSPKHDKIVETSPDVFDSLPEFFSSRFK